MIILKVEAKLSEIKSCFSTVNLVKVKLSKGAKDSGRALIASGQKVEPGGMINSV
jgi:hypothetical protein